MRRSGGLVFSFLHFFSESFRDGFSFIFLTLAWIFFGGSLAAWIIFPSNEDCKFLLGGSSLVLLWALYNRWRSNGISGVDVESLMRGDHNFPDTYYPHKFEPKRRRKKPKDPV